jgi:small GTP-binding protein
MATDKFVTAAVAGHPEHGKTTLVRSLTGIDSNPYDESEEAGVSSETSFALFRLPSGVRIALVDMPNHSDLPQRTAGSLNTIDLAILVVAADDGVMPQTKDQLEVLNRFKAREGLAVISKADLVDHETIEIARMEIQEISKGSCLEGKPIIPFSAADRRGLDQILATIEAEADRVDGRGYFATNHYRVLKKHVLDSVTEILVHNVFQVAVSFDELRCRREPTPDEWLLGRMLRELCALGKLIRVDGGYRIPTLPVRLSSNREKVAGQMLDYARSLGYVAISAPIFCEIHWKSFKVGEIRQLLEYLCAREKLVRLNDGRYLTCQAMEEIKEKVTEFIVQKGVLTVHDGKEILGYGRMRVIPVLEYLDSIGLTCRIDNVRVLRSEEDSVQQVAK